MFEIKSMIINYYVFVIIISSIKTQQIDSSLQNNENNYYNLSKSRSISCQDLRFVSRLDWGAKSTLPGEELQSFIDLNNNNNDNAIPLPKRVIIHHAWDGRTCYDIDSCSIRMKAIQAYHQHIKNWPDISYNFLISGDGTIYEGVGFNKIGFHTLNYNEDSLGIALIGTFQDIKPPERMLSALNQLIDCALDENYLDLNYLLHGHRDARCTICPGNEAYNVIKRMDRFSPGPLEFYTCPTVDKNMIITNSKSKYNDPNIKLALESQAERVVNINSPQNKHLIISLNNNDDKPNNRLTTSAQFEETSFVGFIRRRHEQKQHQQQASIIDNQPLQLHDDENKNSLIVLRRRLRPTWQRPRQKEEEEFGLLEKRQAESEGESISETTTALIPDDNPASSSDRLQGESSVAEQINKSTGKQLILINMQQPQATVSSDGSTSQQQQPIMYLLTKTKIKPSAAILTTPIFYTTTSGGSSSGGSYGGDSNNNYGSSGGGGGSSSGGSSFGSGGSSSSGSSSNGYGSNLGSTGSFGGGGGGSGGGGEYTSSNGGASSSGGSSSYGSSNGGGSGYRPSGSSSSSSGGGGGGFSSGNGASSSSSSGGSRRASSSNQYPSSEMLTEGATDSTQRITTTEKTTSTKAGSLLDKLFDLSIFSHIAIF